ncbi:SemiSWEET family transporter [Lactobacillus gasseri]|uniref:SemiSWEET family transporter n=1 Tax=Lactobacillus gasseri TaxID=1596 RepID=UPI00237E1D27|nr:SemiSWEET family transporter [Lactobacillus gasseri]MDE1526651.1 SemiSWEET family transporter [Lactobacillus gasseri]
MKEQRKKDKTFLVVGRIASIISVLMYVSYIAQIISNFQGQKGNPIQPLVAAVNATLWVIYGWINPVERDWSIIIANAPGVILGLIAGITCF